MKFLVLQHIAGEGLVVWEDCCREAGIVLEVVDLPGNGPLPRPGSFHAVICLGGPMNVYQELHALSRRLFQKFCRLVALRYEGVGPAAPADPPPPARRASRRHLTAEEARQQYRELMGKGKLRCRVTLFPEPDRPAQGGCWQAQSPRPPRRRPTPAWGPKPLLPAGSPLVRASDFTRLAGRRPRRGFPGQPGVSPPASSVHPGALPAFEAFPINGLFALDKRPGNVVSFKKHDDRRAGL